CLADRGMLTTTPTCHLPSLFGACEPPADPAARGFARLPADKWWWDSSLAERPGVHRLKVLRGKVLLVDAGLVALLRPLCGGSLAAAATGELGGLAARLVEHLRAAGPSLLDDARGELGLDTKAMRQARQVTESRGAVVSREVTVPARNGGHRHTSELRRWDQTDLAGRG